MTRTTLSGFCSSDILAGTRAHTICRAAMQLEHILPAASWEIQLRGEASGPGELERVQKLIDESFLQERIHIRPPVFDAEKVACLASTDCSCCLPITKVCPFR